MKDNLHVALRLTIICFVSVLLLSLVNLFTASVIKRNDEGTAKEANKVLFPSGEFFIKKEFKTTTETIKKDTEFYFEVLDKNKRKIGYIAAVTGSGFSGDLNLLIAFGNNLEIINMKLLKNTETPGFGKKWENQESMNMFVGTNTPDKPFPDKKSKVSPEFQDGPNGVTGATITFNGITQAVSKAIRLMKNL